MNQVLVDKPNIEIYGKIDCPVVFRWTRIMVFQFWASFFFTYAVMATYYDKKGLVNLAHSGFISLAMFLVFCLCGQLTGGHANPIITLSLMFTRGTKIGLIEGVVYIVSQFAGSIAGGAVAYGVVDKFDCARPGLNQSSVTQTFGGQIIGAFLFILFLLIVLNDTTTFVKSNFWNYLLVPVIFFICRTVTSQINGLNPAMTLANQIFYGVKYNDYKPLNTYWVYIIGPLIGLIAAVLLFNVLYFPLFLRWKAKK